jgi:hypothetical protein
MDSFIPDIVGYKGGRRLLVEIVVTHDLDERKMAWIRENNFAVVRVNLSWLSYDATRSMIDQALRDGRMVNCTPRINIVNWVHHPRLAEAQSEVDQQYLRSIGEI